MQEFVCPAGYNDRLDRALAALVPDLSRTRARRLIDAGSVFVDGRRCRVAGRTVHGGTRVWVRDDAPPASASAATLRVLYEDAHLIAIDKPAGMPSTPTRQAAAGTALEELRQHMRRSAEVRIELHPVHRLDTLTSGVLLFAKDASTAAHAGEQFATGAVTKNYVAIVRGAPAARAGTILAPLRREAGRAVVGEDGKPAQTDWCVIGFAGPGTVLRVTPHTGRMHQIRAHLAHVGHPILGDVKYGGPPAERLLLHAARIALTHPGTGVPLAIECPVPFASTPAPGLPEEP